jgi:hypothetical protein
VVSRASSGPALFRRADVAGREQWHACQNESSRVRKNGGWDLLLPDLRPLHEDINAHVLALLRRGKHHQRVPFELNGEHLEDGDVHFRRLAIDVVPYELQDWGFEVALVRFADIKADLLRLCCSLQFCEDLSDS